MDPPRHGKFRQLVSRGFTPRMVARLETRLLFEERLRSNFLNGVRALPLRLSAAR